jgi:hypothetical protein
VRRGLLAPQRRPIEDAADVQAAVGFNLFQLMQATARGDGLGVPAKGMTGHGYEGHYFWDTEVYGLLVEHRGEQLRLTPETTVVQASAGTAEVAAQARELPRAA